MMGCECDWPTVVEPPSLYQDRLELHRAMHDLMRELVYLLGIEKLLRRIYK